MTFTFFFSIIFFLLALRLFFLVSKVFICVFKFVLRYGNTLSLSFEGTTITSK